MPAVKEGTNPQPSQPWAMDAIPPPARLQNRPKVNLRRDDHHQHPNGDTREAVWRIDSRSYAGQEYVCRVVEYTQMAIRAKSIVVARRGRWDFELTDADLRRLALAVVGTGRVVTRIVSLIAQ